MTITEFIEARLAEREAGAIAAAEYPGKDWVNHPGRDATESVVFEDAGSPFAWIDSAGSAAIGEHIAWHDPRRVLRDVEAKRAIIGEQTSDHAPIESAYGLTCRTCVAWQDDEGVHEFGIAIPETWPCRVARALAATDSDHPDYDPSWAPNPT